MKNKTAASGLASVLLSAGLANAADEARINVGVGAGLYSKSETVSSELSPLVVQRELSGWQTSARAQFPVANRVAVDVEAVTGKSTGQAKINGLNINNRTYETQFNDSTSIRAAVDAALMDRRLSLGLATSYAADNRLYTFPVTGATDDLNIRGSSLDLHGAYAFRKDMGITARAGMETMGQQPRNLYAAISRATLEGEFAKLFDVPKTTGIAVKVGPTFSRETYKAENNSPSKTITVDHTGVMATAETNPYNPIPVGELRFKGIRVTPNGVSARLQGQYGFGRNGGYGAGASVAGHWKDLEVRASAEYQTQRSQLQHTQNTQGNFRAFLTGTYGIKK